MFSILLVFNKTLAYVLTFEMENSANVKWLSGPTGEDYGSHTAARR